LYICCAKKTSKLENYQHESKSPWDVASHLHQTQPSTHVGF